MASVVLIGLSTYIVIADCLVMRRDEKFSDKIFIRKYKSVMA